MAQIQGGGSCSFRRVLPGRAVGQQPTRTVTSVREVQAENRLLYIGGPKLPVVSVESGNERYRDPLIPYGKGEVQHTCVRIL